MTIGFIGLGRMGSSMARSALRAGHSVIAYNRTRSRAEELAKQGGRVANRPADTAEAEVILTMLSDDPAVEETVLGEDGIARAMRPSQIHVSHSTISVALSKRLEAEHRSRGQQYIAAPVFGRPEAAAAAKLIIAAAGPGDAIERCRPIFEAMGRQTLVAGAEPWKANVVKLCGNFMLASMLEGFGEALATLRKSEVDPMLFVATINGLFQSPVYENYGKAIAEERFEPAGFALRLGLKDIRLALAAADQIAAPMPLASLLHDRLLSALAQGQGEMDWSSVSKISAMEAGLKSASR